MIATIEAMNLANEKISEAIEEDLRPSAEQVKLSARNLVNYATHIQQKHESIINKANNLKVNNEEAALKFTRDMIKSKEEFKQMMNYVFDFQEKANNFLGQKIIMTIVYIDPTFGTVELLKKENTADELDIVKDKDIYKGKYTMTKEKLAQYQHIIDSDYEDKKTLDITFQEVWQRYRISRNILKDLYSASGWAYILWKTSSGWDGHWIGNAGPLGEAYVAFFINRYKFTNAIELAVKDFMLNKSYGAVRADTASGFLQGDVVKDFLEFGVKTVTNPATALNFIDIIKYAKQVEDAADVRKFLLKLKKSLAQNSGKQTKKLSELIERTGYNEVKKAMQNRVKQIGTEFDFEDINYEVKIY